MSQAVRFKIDDEHYVLSDYFAREAYEDDVPIGTVSTHRGWRYFRILRWSETDPPVPLQLEEITDHQPRYVLVANPVQL